MGSYSSPARSVVEPSASWSGRTSGSAAAPSDRHGHGLVPSRRPRLGPRAVRPGRPGRSAAHQAAGPRRRPDGRRPLRQHPRADGGLGRGQGRIPPPGRRWRHLRGDRRPALARTRACGPGRFLVLGDTTELDFGIHRRVPDLAPTGNGGGYGFHLHAALVVGAEDERIIGLAGERVHYRKPAPEGENTSQRLKRDRESDVWGDVIDQVGPPAAATRVGPRAGPRRRQLRRVLPLPAAAVRLGRAGQHVAPQGDRPRGRRHDRPGPRRVLAGGGRIDPATPCPAQAAGAACAAGGPLRRDDHARALAQEPLRPAGRRDAGADVAGRGRRGRLPPGRQADRMGALHVAAGAGPRGGDARGRPTTRSVGWSRSISRR